MRRFQVERRIAKDFAIHWTFPKFDSMFFGDMAVGFEATSTYHMPTW